MMKWGGPPAEKQRSLHSPAASQGGGSPPAEKQVSTHRGQALDKLLGKLRDGRQVIRLPGNQGAGYQDSRVSGKK